MKTFSRRSNGPKQGNVAVAAPALLEARCSAALALEPLPASQSSCDGFFESPEDPYFFGGDLADAKAQFLPSTAPAAAPAFMVGQPAPKTAATRRQTGIDAAAIFGKRQDSLKRESRLAVKRAGSAPVMQARPPPNGSAAAAPASQPAPTATEAAHCTSSLRWHGSESDGSPNNAPAAQRGTKQRAQTPAVPAATVGTADGGATAVPQLAGKRPAGAGMPAKGVPAAGAAAPGASQPAGPAAHGSGGGNGSDKQARLKAGAGSNQVQDCYQFKQEVPREDCSMPARASSAHEHKRRKVAGSSVPPSQQSQDEVPLPAQFATAANQSKRARGSSRAAAGGSQPGPQQPCPSSPEATPPPAVSKGAPAAAAAAAGVGAAAGTPVAPGSILQSLRPLRPLALAARLGSIEAAPVQTVMEAQERGELVQLQDDARYALDGLGAGASIGGMRESAVGLAEMLATRKGRLALRAESLAQQVLSSLAKLNPGKDPVLALAAATTLLALSMEDAHPAYLTSNAAALLFKQLLQAPHCQGDPPGSMQPQSQRLSKLMLNGTFGRCMPSDVPLSAQTVALVALVQATSAQQGSRLPFVEKIKMNVLKYRVLERLARIVAVQAAAFTAAMAGSPSPAAPEAHEQPTANAAAPAATAAAVTANATAGDATAPAAPHACAAWQLHMAFLALENVTFACPDNEAHLVQLQVPTGQQQQQQSQAGSQLLQKSVSPSQLDTQPATQPESQLESQVESQLELQLGLQEGQPQAGKLPLPAVLLQLLPHLQQGMATGQPHAQACLHACLAVLMNLSHQNEQGVGVICAAGGFICAARVLLQLFGPWQPGKPLDRALMLEHVELISVTLGLLINLLAGSSSSSSTNNSSDGNTNRDKCSDSRQQLWGVGGAAVAGNGDGNAGLPAADSDVLLQLLCAVVSAANAESKQEQQQRQAKPAHGHAARCSPEQQQAAEHSLQWQQPQQQQEGESLASPASSGSMLVCSGSVGAAGTPLDVTEQHLATNHTLAEASIVEVYSAMLLGFMVQGAAVLQQRAAAMLGGSLAPVMAAIQRFLAFYVSAGAITDASRDALLQLLAELEAPQQGSAVDAAGAVTP